MTPFLDLLVELQSRDIRLRAESGRLKIDAPESAMTDELRERIRLHRAELLASFESGLRAGEAVPSPNGGGESVYPLSPAQHAFFMLDALDPGNRAYNICSVRHVRGPLDTERVERALELVVSQHETLRTTFEVRDGNAVQMVHASGAPNLDIVNLSTEPHRTTLLQHYVSRSRAPRFDLARGPLFRVDVIRVSPESHYLIVWIHHIIADATSLDVFYADLITAYFGASSSSTPPVAVRGPQYGDYARWQRTRLDGGLLNHQIDYWATQLANVGSLLEPIVVRGSSSTRATTVTASIPPRVVAAMGQVASRLRTTPFVVLVAAYALLLARYTGAGDVPVIVPVANRDRPEIQRLMGVFVNGLVMRVAINETITVAELLEQVRGITAAALAHGDISIETLEGELRKRGRACAELSQLSRVMFNYMVEQPNRTMSFDNFDITPVTVDREDSIFEVMLELVAKGSDLEARLAFRTDLFDRGVMEPFLAHYVALLEPFCIDVSARAWDISFVGNDELARALNADESTSITGLDATQRQLLRLAFERDRRCRVVGYMGALPADCSRTTIETALHRMTKAAPFRSRIVESSVRYLDPAYVCTRDDGTTPPRILEFNAEDDGRSAALSVLEPTLIDLGRIAATDPFAACLVSTPRGRYFGFFANELLLSAADASAHRLEFESLLGASLRPITEEPSVQNGRHSAEDALRPPLETARFISNTFVLSAEEFEGVIESSHSFGVDVATWLTVLFGLLAEVQEGDEDSLQVVRYDWRPAASAQGDLQPHRVTFEAGASTNLANLMRHACAPGAPEHRGCPEGSRSYVLELRDRDHDATSLDLAIATDGCVRLTVHLDEVSARLTLAFDRTVWPDLAAARRLRSLILQVASGIRSSAELSLLLDEERVRLRELNRTEAPQPTACVHQLVEQQARRTPDAIAVQAGHRSLTYGELDRSASRLAVRISQHDCAEIVGVCSSRTEYLPIALLAVLKAGRAYLPLDPAYPRARLQAMIERAGVRCVLADAASAPQVPSGSFALVRVDAADPGEPECASPVRKVPLDAAAYVLFTSGTAGRPKGVLVQHRAAANLLIALTQQLEISSNDILAAVTTASFDIAFLELFAPLTAGGTVVIASREDVVDAQRLAHLIDASGATLLQTTPTLWRSLLDRGWRGKPGLRALCGGEPLPVDLAERLLDHVDDLWNLYGPTETTVWSTAQRVRRGARIGIGRPIANTRVFLVDRDLRLVPPGAVGELCIGGTGVSTGYLHDPDLTAEHFRYVRGLEGEQQWVYLTGDRARLNRSGDLELLGRCDRQVKIRGMRIELEEVESCLRLTPGVLDAAVLVTEAAGGPATLSAYIATTATPLDEALIRRHLRERLPDAMIPEEIVTLAALPLTPNGKVDVAALAKMAPQAHAALVRPRSAFEREIADAWSTVLGREIWDTEAGFFDIGGHSMALLNVHQILRERLPVPISVADLFAHPTIAGLAGYLDAARKEWGDARGHERRPANRESESIAIIGVAGRFPAAPDVETFWRNLGAGVESVEFLSEEELVAEGCPTDLIRDPAYVRAASTLADVDCFDAAFFQLTQREAVLLDPQHRLLLECAHACLEDAGHDATSASARVGVFVGTGLSAYLVRHVLPQPDLLATASPFDITYANERDYAATRISYALGLRGPSINVGTACSTGLVAVHYAAESLRRRECDLALAGVAKVALPQRIGYYYTEGGILSPDGHCRPFDRHGAGTIFGSGVGVVALKRLEDALHDRDAIYAVIKGSAVNNDGRMKPGFTAPSVQGQAEVITQALDQAGVDPASIGFVEAHGTATRLGDPIEVTALTRAFGGSALPQASCALGSVKSNIGHLDHAAGIAGLIKAVGCLHLRQIPPTLHFEAPNEQLELERTPFYVNTTPREWTAGHSPRRAAVSSFGIGGTNAHVVLEEAPQLPESPDASASDPALLVVSARTPTALAGRIRQLSTFLEANPHASLADVAYTLQAGRQPMRFRWAAVAQDHTAALTALHGSGQPVDAKGERPALAFMFPGQGSQYPGMAADLYRTNPAFRRAFDDCAQEVRPHLDVSLAELVFATGPAAAQRLTQTRYVQPVLFAVEYSLARTLMDWGLIPDAMIGHSLGEYVAACIAGVFSLDVALDVVAHRARLMQDAPHGRMAVAFASVEVVERVLGVCDVAAVNGEDLSVIAGSEEAVREACDRLARLGAQSRLLDGAKAFHSSSMESVVPEFRAALDRIPMSPPRIPFVSNVTGTWISDDEGVDPEYWCRHLRRTVRFHDGATLLLADPRCTLIEVGPGESLTAVVRRRVSAPGQMVLRTFPRTNDKGNAMAAVLDAVGRAWARGHTINWTALYDPNRRRRLHLPTYPFERTRAWLDAPSPRHRGANRSEIARRDIEDAFFLRSWRQSQLPSRPSRKQDTRAVTLVFSHEADEGLGSHLIERLNATGARVLAVRPRGEPPPHDAGDSIEVDLLQPLPFARLAAEIARAGRFVDRVLHLWNVRPVTPRTSANLDPALQSLVQLIQSLAQGGTAPALRATVVSSHLNALRSTDVVDPERALALGVVRAAPYEYAGTRWTSIDIDQQDVDLDLTVDRLLSELDHDLPASSVSYRDRRRFTLGLEPCVLVDCESLPPQPCVVIVGGLGGIGFTLAEHLMRTRGARVSVFGRTLLSDLPAQGGDHDPSSKAGRLQVLNGLGRVSYHTVDVSHEVDVRAALLAVNHDVGPIDLVVHAAGVADGLPIYRRTGDEIARALASKVRGAANVDRISVELGIPRVVFCGSVTALTGAPGQLAYCASNSYVTALVEAGRCRGLDRVVISWDTWGEVGMAVTTDVPEAFAQARRDALARGITRAEGVRAFDRILGSRLDHVIVAVRDLLVDHTAADTTSTKPAAKSTYASADVPQLDHVDGLVSHNVTVLERELLDIWRESFRTTAIEPTDDFFELGGHSLLAVHLAGRLAARLRTPVDPSILLEHPTIRALATHLEARSRSHHADSRGESPVVRLRDGSPGVPPFWLVHPVGGLVSPYRLLARMLRTPQSVFGLRSMESITTPADTVEALAASYLKCIRAVSNSGPYCLGGSSFGGVVAYQMAQQLRREGADVALLAMIDSPSGLQVPPGFGTDSEILAYLSAELPASAGLTLAMLEAQPEASRIAYFCSRLPATDEADEIRNEQAVTRLVELFRSHMRAMRRYRAEPYSGRVLFFRASERRPGRDPEDPERTWRTLAPAMVLESVPGNHMTMHVPPHVETLAERLSLHLGEALLAHAES